MDIDFQGYYNDALALFGGNTSFFRIALIALVVYLGWGHWASIYESVKKAISHFIEEFKAKKAAAPSKADSSKVAAEDPLSSLQAMTTWAVKNSTPEVLGKITALFQDLQSVGREKK